MSSSPIEFSTARLNFRVWQAHHVAPFVAMNGDAEVMRYFPAVMSHAQSQEAIDRWMAAFRERGWSLWAVERRDDGSFIGCIGLTTPLNPIPYGPCVEVGWRLVRAAWGRGYATEGAAACLNLAFTRLKLEEVIAITSLLNLRSIEVMKRIGMVNADADFDHPSVPEGHALRRHCVYRMTCAAYAQRR